MKQFYYITISLLFFNVLANAQEFHFTQFATTPMYLNPACTGVLNRDLRAGVTYRDQARSVAKSYSSVAANLDMALYPKGNGADFWGVGLMATRHAQGFFDLTTVSFNLAGSYSKALDPSGKSFLTFGLMAGFAQQSRSDAVNTLTWDMQWNTQKNKFDASLNPNEDNLTSNGRRNFNYADFAAGALYNGILSPSIQVNGGIALSHLNSPNISFSNSTTAKRTPKLALHGTAEIASGFDAKIRFVPTLLYLRQGPQQLINVGIGTKFVLGINSKYTEFNKESSFLVGVQYRYKDAISPIIRYELSSYTIGFAYDLTISTLKNTNKSLGAFEFSLIYNGKTEFGGKAKKKKLRFL